jgi:Ca2+-binding RTX toxin-like protein
MTPAVSHCELLQTRILPVVTTFVDGVLTIEFDEATESEVVVESSPDLQFGIHVNGQLLDLDSGPMIAPRANDIVELVIRPASQFSSEDASLGANRIDVFHLLTTEFTNLSVVSIDSGFGDDEVTGSRFADRIVGGPGNDTVIGQHGNDTINGGAGNDSLDGTRGHDVLIGGSGDDQITGGLDNDTITGGNGADILAGDAGNDVLDGGNHADQMNGGDGNDVLRGRGGLDTLRGGAGNDRLYGNGSRNALFGDAGHDTVIGGPARDRLRGGPGNDILLGFGGRDHLLGNAGDDLANGGDDHDTVRGGEGNDFVYGQRGSDFLTGDAGNDLVDGGVSDDLLHGGSGADTLNAGTGNDAITSGEDAGIADIIDGGDGQDSLLDETGGDDVVTSVETEAGTGEVVTRPLATTFSDHSLQYTTISGAGETDQGSADVHQAIRLDEFAAMPEFADIDGVYTDETGSHTYSVVIIDTGMDLDHTAFGPDVTGPEGVPDGVADRIVHQYDFGNNDADAGATNGHGTFVADVAAGASGIAPDVHIISLKVFPDGSGGAPSTAIEDALQWVVANATAYNIASINMSLGFGLFTSESDGADIYGDELSTLAEMNVVTVAAAGNSFASSGSLPAQAFPSVHSDVIAVGASYDSDYGDEDLLSVYGSIDNSTDLDRIAAFSSRHPDLLDVFAPGGSVDGAWLNNSQAIASGTSMASPVVAGAVPLIQEIAQRELGRRLTVNEFRDLLRSTGERIFDGDDEDDNVDNTNRWYRRLDMVALGQAVIAMGANDPTGGISNAIGAGAYQNDGVADEYTIRRQVSTVTVDVDGIPTEFLSPADLEIVLSTTDAQSNPVETVIWRQLIDEMNDTEFDENNVLIDIPVELRLAGSSDDDLIVLDFSDGDGGQVLPAGGNFDLVGGLTLLAGSQTTGDSIEIRRGDAPNPAGGFDDAVTEVTHSFDQEGVPLVTISSTLSASVDTVTTSVSVADGAAFTVSQTVIVDTEEMLIEAIAGNILTVSRGQNGTSATTHAVSAPMTVLVGDTINQVRIVSEELVSGTGSSLSAAVDELTTAFVVNDGTEFTVTQILAIENEDVLVTAVNGNVLIVERGVRGTESAAHA